MFQTEGSQRCFGHGNCLNRLLIVKSFCFSVTVPIGITDWPINAVRSCCAVEEVERCFRHVEELFVRPALSGNKQSMRQYGVRIGQASLEPLPVMPRRAVVT